MPKGSKWRMVEKCETCPFATSGKGYALRKSLRPSSWRSILAGLRAGAMFECHKTTDETGDGSRLVCTGSLEYQDKLGISSQYTRVCRRLDAIAARRLEGRG